jgi:hypothetical protein
MAARIFQALASSSMADKVKVINGKKYGGFLGETP